MKLGAVCYESTNKLLTPSSLFYSLDKTDASETTPDTVFVLWRGQHVHDISFYLHGPMILLMWSVAINRNIEASVFSGAKLTARFIWLISWKEKKKERKDAVALSSPSISPPHFLSITSNT